MGTIGIDDINRYKFSDVRETVAEVNRPRLNQTEEVKVSRKTHKTSISCRFNVGPALQTLVQNKSALGECLVFLGLT